MFVVADGWILFRSSSMLFVFVFPLSSCVFVHTSYFIVFFVPLQLLILLHSPFQRHAAKELFPVIVVNNQPPL